MELLDYEEKHIRYFEDNAHESTLFLKRNGAFPIDKPCKVALFGNGARHTVKGGTGSGDVASRYFVNFEKGLEDAGFTVTSKSWLDEYDAVMATWHKDYVRRVKKESRQLKILSVVNCMGNFDYEHDYDINTECDGDIAVYCLSRSSGEGSDRKTVKGDVLLSDSEVRDILYLNKKFEKFVLVLNVGGVVDLTPVLEVSNILYISQLGVVTGSILPKILLGQCSPSGKLSTTWAKLDDYEFLKEFGDKNDTYYKEGIYVGYRYFDSVNKEPYFPFGFGLSYTDFTLETVGASLEGDKVSVSVKVTNVGKHSGKEVVQCYVSAPKGKLDKEYQRLVGYRKTSLLSPGESETVTVCFSIKDCASYDEETASWILESDGYIVRAGNSSRNTEPVLIVNVEETIVTEKLANKLGKSGFKDFVRENGKEVPQGVKTAELDPACIVTKTAEYEKDVYVDEEINKLTDDELIAMTLGQTGKGAANIVGNASSHAPGAAGETTLNVKSIDKYLVMADGPAGLRLKQKYGIDKKGTFSMALDPLDIQMIEFLPLKFISKHFILPPTNRKPDEVRYQYTTAIPIGTALAMSFNDDYVRECGRIVADEMNRFDIDLWLAPALNIHRNILCGRNFEYYSEDPLLSGKTAAAITQGVQEDGKHGTTIKHFAANNQELNRTNNNGHVSERAMREIYLRGFEICIRESRPLALMTSYNLVNGVHTAESHELVNDILRCEWGYQGLVMTDWSQSGRNFCYGGLKYKAVYASNTILSGNDLFMPGSSADIRNLKKALKSGKITRDDLVHSASRIYRSIKVQKH